IATNDAREAGHALPCDRIPLVRHGARTFLAFCKKFLSFQNLGTLEMSKLSGPTFDAGGDEGEMGHEFGVDIALDDLRGDRRRLEPELVANELFHARRQMRAGADSAGNFPNGDAFPRDLEPLLGAAKFVIHKRKLETE